MGKKIRNFLRRLITIPLIPVIFIWGILIGLTVDEDLTPEECIQKYLYDTHIFDWLWLE